MKIRVLIFVAMTGMGVPFMVHSVMLPCVHHGDVNLDGQITAADAQLAFFIVLGLYSPTYEEECAADCNGDETVTAADAQIIFLVVLGQSDCADPLTPSFAVYIPPGTYTRGSPDDEPCQWPEESPQHQVTLTRGFFMMRTEVTRQMWEDAKVFHPALPGDPSSTSISPTMDHPVQFNTWYETILFSNVLSLQEGFTQCYYTNATFTIPVDATNYITDEVYCNFSANGYRLPTEAEWEYACRAGTTGPFSANEPNYNAATCETCSPGLPLHVLDSIAWWCGNSDTGSGYMAHPVGTKLANSWGLYDTHGNVMEWCWDRFAGYPSESVTDPTGPTIGSYRVIRGGSWNCYAQYCRSAIRLSCPESGRSILQGFRLVRTAP